MRKSLRFLAALVVFIPLANMGASAQNVPANSAQLDYSTLLQFSVDIAKFKEDGNSAIPFSTVVGWNMAITYPFYTPEESFEFKEAKAFKSEAYDADDKPAPKWRPGIFGSLQYIEKGGKFDGTTGRTNYLELTIFGEFDAAAGDGAAFFRLGPYFGYGVGGKIGSGSQAEPSFGGENYRRFDAGASIGLGYRFLFGGVFYLCYEYGLVNKAPKLNGGFPSDYTDKNRAFSFNFGYPIDKIIGAFKSK